MLTLSPRETWRKSELRCIDVSSRASRVLGTWLDDPVVTRSLARRGLMEVAAKCEVEIGRDYALERDALKRNGSV